MRTLVRLSLVSACVAASAVATLTQTQTTPARQDEQKVVVDAGEVLFDVVVRDKRGRVVKDLGASDFEVYEDGVAQQLNSFRLVARGGRDSAPAPNESAQGTPKSQPAPAASPKTTADDGVGLTAVAIVFDRLTPDGRARSRSAALAYVEEMRKDGLVGIFLTDLSLVVLQPYTDDMRLARRGIENAGASNPSMYASNNQRARAVRGQVVELINKTNRAGSLDEGVQQRGLAEMEKQALVMELWNLERWEEIQRDQQGAATTTGLLAVASSLGKLPGRKAVILFSEGLIIPPGALEPFRAIVKAGNPFQVGELLLYPNTGEAVRGEAGEQLTFFFTAYAPRDATVPPKLVIELRQSGKTLASMPAQMNAPDSRGRIQYVAGLPLGSIPPGAYELKVTVEDGKSTLSRSAPFSVAK